MNYRTLGKTGFKISEISLGTWQVGGKWGNDFSFKNAENIINTAIDNGVNFIDTADVYSDGFSEEAVGKALKNKRDKIYVATKCGRKLNPFNEHTYTPKAMRQFVEDSLSRMKLETLDLIQLHCPPTASYFNADLFGEFELLKKEGKIQNLGVSVELVSEAMKAIEYTNVTSVQIIFNMFRLKPSELFFAEAAKKNIGIIVRVPLASGLLTGTFGRNTTFTAGDHRNFNRNGEAFDKGETFSGVNYDLALTAVEELKKIFPGQANLAPIALRWILMFPEISCIIPGASRPEQMLLNLQALKQSALTPEQMQAVKVVYEKYIKPSVHNLW